ncbi:MAG: hypothetical protein KF822_11310 [Steroidobacteraceae bacterium]|nr:hypothetical protein [Steroidobacteraceae bacterium]
MAAASTRHALLVGACALASVAWADPPDKFLIRCEGVLGPDITVTRLEEAFGAEQVRNAELYLGEGKTEAGTVLFAPVLDEMIQVFWKDPPQKHLPRFLRVNGRTSRWHTVQGITLGSDLQTLERINGRSFILKGFGWDYSGTVVSWLGGFLETAFSPCRFVVRFIAEQKEPGPEWFLWYEQVIGDREFQSTYFAMQSLNPRIRAIELHYP